MFFGLGYNSAMAIDVALQENPDCEVEVVGIEYDPEIIKKIQEVNPPINFFQHYKKINELCKLIVNSIRITNFYERRSRFVNSFFVLLTF